VFGFRAVKGLEFEEVAIVDFFTHEPDKLTQFFKDQQQVVTGAGAMTTHEDEMTPDIQKAWKFYFEKYTYDDRKARGLDVTAKPPKEVELCKNGARPFIIEIQLKLLYTGE
jgi:hypothetical protein